MKWAKNLNLISSFLLYKNEWSSSVQLEKENTVFYKPEKKVRYMGWCYEPRIRLFLKIQHMACIWIVQTEVPGASERQGRHWSARFAWLCPRVVPPVRDPGKHEWWRRTFQFSSEHPCLITTSKYICVTVDISVTGSGLSGISWVVILVTQTRGCGKMKARITHGWKF